MANAPCQPQGDQTQHLGVSQLLGTSLKVTCLHVGFLLPQNETHYKFGYDRWPHNEEDSPHFLSSCVSL